MFLTKKHLSRRTVLRGMGATIALPFLDSMIPARSIEVPTMTSEPSVSFGWAWVYITALDRK